MSQPETSSNRPDNIFEAPSKNVNDAFETLSLTSRVYKASLGLLIFGNLLPLVPLIFGGEAVFTKTYLEFNILLVMHTICLKCLSTPGQSHSSSPSASSTTDREQ